MTWWLEAQSSKTKPISKKRELLEGKESIIHGFLTMKYLITSWNKLVRKECITDNKLLFIENIYLQDQPWLYYLVSHINSMLLLPHTTFFYEEAPESTNHGALNPERAQRYVNSWKTVFEYYLSRRPNSKDFKHNLEVDYLLYLQRTHLRAIFLFPYEKKDYNQILVFRNKIMSLALKDGRFLIACFLLLEYRPFIYLFRFRFIRSHYYYMIKIVGHIAHLFDFFHRKKTNLHQLINSIIQNMIPKIIHYCWLSGDEFPTLFKKCINSWKKQLPGWEFRLWDKTCLEEINEPWVYEAYEAKVYSHASDYIRLYAVYKYGGFYLDCDVEVLKDLSPFIELDYVLSKENSDSGYIEAAIFGAHAGNPYLRKCMEKYHDRHFILEDGSYDYKFRVEF